MRNNTLLEPQTHAGVTAAGWPMTVTLGFPPDALVGALPVAITGAYAALDGGGTFALTRLPAGCWRDADRGAESAQSEVLLPGVVAEGTW